MTLGRPCCIEIHKRVYKSTSPSHGDAGSPQVIALEAAWELRFIGVAAKYIRTGGKSSRSGEESLNAGAQMRDG